MLPTTVLYEDGEMHARTVCLQCQCAQWLWLGAAAEPWGGIGLCAGRNIVSGGEYK